MTYIPFSGHFKLEDSYSNSKWYSLILANTVWPIILSSVAGIHIFIFSEGHFGVFFTIQLPTWMEDFQQTSFSLPNSVSASGYTLPKHLLLGPAALADSSTEHNPIESP